LGMKAPACQAGASPKSCNYQISERYKRSQQFPESQSLSLSRRR
jgi:hypothetical protein